MLPVSIVTVEKQNSDWQTWAVGDTTPYGRDHWCSRPVWCGLLWEGITGEINTEI
jgi:hypothetical protein